MTRRSRSICAASLALAGALVAATPAAADTFLLSVRGILLRSTEFVEAFELSTSGVEVLAVCRIPPGWSIRAGGGLAGRSETGGAPLDRPRLGELTNLVLVEFEPAPRRTYRGERGEPGPIEGYASVGRYDDVRFQRTVTLAPGHLGLRRADRCPDPDAS